MINKDKNTNNILSLNDICKSYIHKDDIINVIHDFNLDIKEGEFISIFGPNGCGKTTLLNLISSIEQPSSGSIVFNPFSNKRIGVVFQDYNNSLMPWLNCLKNICFPLEKNESLSVTDKEKIAYEILNLLGINEWLPMKNYPYQMSGGEKQLTCIARALITDPDILLFDEPFASLDFQTRMEMISMLDRLWIKTRKTIIFISHDINEAIRLSGRVLLLAPRPTFIKHEYLVPMDRPRLIDVEVDKKFVDLKNQILQDFIKLLR